jgi:hypothetical protein
MKLIKCDALEAIRPASSLIDRMTASASGNSLRIEKTG